ncbi:MAG: hypothetical protein P1V97_10035 [Planctomycetota bacterium]|nr:hypothetical protein [Planctomycetota bacterium]
MNQENSDRRRDYTVNRPVQVVYTTTWLASITLLLVLAMLSYNCFQLNDRLQDLDVNVLGMNGFILLGVLAAFLVVISLGLCVYAIVMTHRMLGSSFRIKTVLQEMRKGNWSERAKLRDGDYFLDVAHELNSFMDEHNPQSKEKSETDQSVETDDEAKS